jgi:hypothetical protein
MKLCRAQKKPFVLQPDDGIVPAAGCVEFIIDRITEYEVMADLARRPLNHTVFIPMASDNPAFDLVYYEDKDDVHAFHFVNVTRAFLHRPINLQPCGDFIAHFYDIQDRPPRRKRTFSNSIATFLGSSNAPDVAVVPRNNNEPNAAEVNLPVNANNPNRKFHVDFSMLIPSGRFGVAQMPIIDGVESLQQFDPFFTGGQKKAYDEV